MRQQIDVSNKASVLCEWVLIWSELMWRSNSTAQQIHFISFRFISFQFISQYSAIATVRSRRTMHLLPNHPDGSHIHSRPLYSFLQPYNHSVADNNQFQHFYSLRKDYKYCGRQDGIRNLTETVKWVLLANRTERSLFAEYDICLTWQDIRNSLLPLSWATWIQCVISHSVPLCSVSVLSYCLCFQTGSLTPGFLQ